MSAAARAPEPTRCVACGFCPGGRFIVCPICKAPQPPFDRSADRLVGLGTAFISVFVLLLIAGGYA